MKRRELDRIVRHLARITPERLAEILGRPVAEVAAEMEAARQPSNLDDVGLRVSFTELEEHGPRAVLDRIISPTSFSGAVRTARRLGVVHGAATLRLLQGVAARLEHAIGGAT